MKKLFLGLFLLISVLSYGQGRYFTKTGQIKFDAGTGLEDIIGVNKSVVSAFDSKSGQIQFSVLIKGFEFKSQLMEDHFHENYMESDKFPKSIFSGTIKNIDKIDFAKNGTYPANISGTIEIHGIKKQIEAKGNFVIKDGAVKGISEFPILLSDFGISVPNVVGDKLSKNAKININCDYSILK
jgi:hypothetical protein